MDKRIRDFNVRLRTIRLRELAIAIIACFAITTILSMIFPFLFENDDVYFIILLSFVFLFFVFELRNTTGLSKNFEKLLMPNTMREVLYVFAINIIFAFLFTCLVSGLDLLYGFYDPTWISGFDIDSVDISAGAFILSAIASIIYAPVMEELVFRGVLFNRLKIRIGIIPAMLLSSFLFGIGHEFGGMTSAFLFGMCMCILYLKTDNILVPMSVHFINNVVATILEISGFDVFSAQFPWIIPSLLLSIIGTIYLIKYTVKESKKLKKEYG